MKKRILAFALTLAMVVTSLSMLSFVSFADDVAQNESTAKDFYAYRGTLNVDSKLGVDELWVPVNKEIAPGVAVGMSWDYDNVYIAVYNEPATNGVVGARADYIESFDINVGGATVTGNLTENTTEVSGNGKVVLGYTGAGNPRCVIEAAFPLSEIELDTEALAAGKLVVPATLTINQVYADESLVDTTANLNVILTGRSLAYQVYRVNPSGAYANATELFTGGQVFDRTAGVNVAATAPEEFEEMYVFSGGRGNSSSPFVAVDKSTRDGKVELIRSTMNLREVKSVDKGGQSYFEYQFTINNLPVNGEMSNVDNAVSFTNTPSYIIINNSGIGGAKGTIVNLYNAGGEDGLSVYYPTASGNKSVSLGVEEGEEFWIGFNEVSANKIEIYVNDVLVADDAIAVDSSVSSDKGYIWLGSHRGHSGVGTNGYSLDIDENGVIDEEEQISFKVADATVSSVTPVDVATVASLTKTGGVASSTALMAGYTAKNTVNVASLATATATYNIAKNTVSVSVANTNIDSIKVNVGGFVATATHSFDTESRPDTTLATLDAESIAAGATASVANNVTTISVPLNKVVVSKDSTGNAVAGLQIYVEKSDKASDKDYRINCVTDGIFNGTIAFVTNDATNILDVVMNTKGATGAMVGGDTSSENYGKLIYTQAEGQAVTKDSYFVSLGASYITFAARHIHFDITVADMTPVDVSEVKCYMGVGDQAPYDKMVLHFGSNADPAGAIMYNLVNTTNGGSDGKESLVLAYYNLGEKQTYIIPLDKKVGTKFNIDFVWDAPTYGYVAVDGEVIFEKDDIRSYATMGHITGNINGGPYFRVVRGSEVGTAAFNFTIENLTITTKTHAHTTDRIIAASANSNVVVSEGAIKLSYVQETTYTEAISGNKLTHNTAGASVGSSVMSVSNAAARAFSQGGFSPLAEYTNRDINFIVNVANLNAYDFSNGGALTGDAKYTENISQEHGPTKGIGPELKAHAFDKLMVGFVSRTNDDRTEYSAVTFWIVRDVNDGLVLVHTGTDSSESVIIIGDKISEDIAIRIVWNKDNSGSITVGDETKSYSDIRTIISQFPKKDADNGPQCYFGGYGTVSNGYLGINSYGSTNSSSEGYVAPSATLTLTNVTVGMPLNVRFIATIDTLDAKVAGFDINLKGSEKVVTRTTDTAYNAISTNGDLDKIYAPDGSYFIAVTINDVPATGTVTFVVRPFYTFAGETIYGTAYEVTYTNGAYVGAVAVAE